MLLTNICFLHTTHMHSSIRFLERAAKLVLFTRSNCSLCDTAKSVVSTVRKRHDVDFVEVDIMAAGNEEWREVYEFDVPVVW